MKGEQERGSYRRGGLQRSRKPVRREIRIMKSEGGEGMGEGTGYSSMVGKWTDAGVETQVLGHQS